MPVISFQNQAKITTGRYCDSVEWIMVDPCLDFCFASIKCTLFIDPPGHGRMGGPYFHTYGVRTSDRPSGVQKYATALKLNTLQTLHRFSWVTLMFPDLFYLCFPGFDWCLKLSRSSMMMSKDVWEELLKLKKKFPWTRLQILKRQENNSLNFVYNVFAVYCFCDVTFKQTSHNYV